MTDVFDITRRDRREVFTTLRDEMHDEYASLMSRERNLAARERHGLANRLHIDEQAGPLLGRIPRERARQDSETQRLSDDWNDYDRKSFEKHLLAILIGAYDPFVREGHVYSCSPDPDGHNEQARRACAIRLSEAPDEVAAAERRELEAVKRRAISDQARIDMPPREWGRVKWTTEKDRIAAWCRRPSEDRLRDCRVR